MSVILGRKVCLGLITEILHTYNKKQKKKTGKGSYTEGERVVSKWWLSGAKNCVDLSDDTLATEDLILEIIL